jgi:hypothetical protein
MPSSEFTSASRRDGVPCPATANVCRPTGRAVHRLTGLAAACIVATFLTEIVTTG